MEYLKILLVGIITTIITLIVRQVKGEFAVVVGLSGAILMFIMISNQLAILINYISELFLKTNLNTQILVSLFKIVGVGYLTEFSANLCSDAGCSSIGDKILLGGKLLILVLSLPIINSLISIIVGILPWKSI